MKKIYAAAALIVLLSSAGCSRNGYVAFTGYAQGGTYTVKINTEGVRKNPEKIRSDIDSILLVIDNTLSGYNKGSMLTRYNNGEVFKPNGMFEDIYSISREFWKETGGAVDVASGPLFDIWGFGFTTDSLPDAHVVDSVRAECGMARMPESLDESMGQGNHLNFNAIAQGYSSDAIARYLYGIGVKDMLVDIGEIFCDGVNPGGQPWSIGVDRPFDGNNDPGADLDGIWQSDGGPCGIVTSGNYRKFYTRDGKKYAHTIDPRTGWPVSHNLLSATIVAPDATTADALATYCMVIGLDKAKDFIEKTEGIEGYLIYDNGSRMDTWASEGFNLVKN